MLHRQLARARPSPSPDARRVGEDVGDDDDEIGRILAERACELARKRDSQTAAPSGAVLVRFAVQGVWLALELEVVRRVITQPRLTRIPGAPAYMRKVLYLAGHVLPAVDLGELLALPRGAPEQASQVLVLESDDGLLGVLVDRVSGVQNMDTAALSPPAERAGGASGLIRGLTRDMIVVIDGARLLSQARVAGALGPHSAHSASAAITGAGDAATTIAMRKDESS